MPFFFFSKSLSNKQELLFIWQFNNSSTFPHSHFQMSIKTCHFPKNNCDCSNYNRLVPSQYPLAVKQQLLHNL